MGMVMEEYGIWIEGLGHLMSVGLGHIVSLKADVGIV